MHGDNITDFIFVLFKSWRHQQKKLFEYMSNFEFIAPNGKKYIFRCWYYETRTSWGHWCEVLDDNYNTICKCRIRYYNRTWESYRFQSVALQAVEKAFKRKSDTETREAALKFFHDTTNKGW